MVSGRWVPSVILEDRPLILSATLLVGPFPLVLASDRRYTMFLVYFEHVFYVIPTCILQNTYSLIYVEIG